MYKKNKPSTLRSFLQSGSPIIRIFLIQRFMLDTGYMHVVMNILSNGTPIDSYQSLFSMDTLTNTDMNMNIITHT